MNRSTRFLAALAAALMLANSPGALAGGTVTLLDSWDITEWDPSVYYGPEPRVILNIYETLAFYNPVTGVADPKLATSWSVSDDGLIWTFQLREGVKFHDGSEWNAAAAKANIDRVRELGKGAAYIWASVTATDAPASHTLMIATEYPTPIDLVATSQYAAAMASPAALERGTEWFEKGNAVGTGPYRLVQWEKSQQIVLEKFDDYWGGWTGEEFDRILYRTVAEISTQVQMLRGGEGDVMVSTAPGDLLHELRKDPELEVGVFDSWINVPLMINVGLAPTDNKKFRQGLTHIMDYEAVAKDIYGGFAEVPKSCVPQSMWGAGEHDVAQFDLAKAKMLLEESGVPKPWKVSYHVYTGRQEILQIAEFYQALAAQVGVEVDLQIGDWGVVYNKQQSQETAAHFFALPWWAEWPSPVGWLDSLLGSEDPVVYNLGHYKNPEYDSLIDEGIKLQGSDQVMAAEKFIEAQRIAYDDAAMMCLVDLKKTLLFRADLDGVSFNPAYEWVNVYEMRRE